MLLLEEKLPGSMTNECIAVIRIDLFSRGSRPYALPIYSTLELFIASESSLERIMSAIPL